MTIYQHRLYRLCIRPHQSYKIIIVVQVVIQTRIHGGHYHDEFENEKYVKHVS